MNSADRQTLVREIIADDRGLEALRTALPQLFVAPHLIDEVKDMVVGTLLDYAQVPESKVEEFLAEIAVVPRVVRDEPPAMSPDPAYESDEVARSSATLAFEPAGRLFAPHEIVAVGPSHGNPFVNVAVYADLSDGERTVQVGGFYDGDGRYVVRFLPTAPGEWNFTIRSNARSLDGLTGKIIIAPSGLRGPVRAVGHHFEYASGEPYAPFGTTLYAWNHQKIEREEETLRTLANGPFTKVRMCVFPKHYDFTTEEPDLFPFVRDEAGDWDTTRFNPAFFQHLERRVTDLAELGIEADLILFHPYDRWGFQDLGVAADDRFVSYVVNRLSGLPNVWWSLANENDLMWSKRVDDWVRIGELVSRTDHASHLLSIHNGTRLFDFSYNWITHCSIQKTDPRSPVDHIETWRNTWGKPVVIDEPGYEGDIEFEWGSLSAAELVHRFWAIAVRGGYTTHGETYRNPTMQLWWATGGELVGQSPARIDLLARITREAPQGRLDPISGVSHIKAAGSRGVYEVHYFGFYQPRSFTFTWPEGRTAAVEIIDTWSMERIDVPGGFSDRFTIDLPGRPHIAVLLKEVRA